MVFTTSQMDAFEDAVLELIAAELVDEDVQVSIGPLGDDSNRDSIQTLGGPSTQNWVSLPGIRKREDMQIVIAVKAEVSGKGPEKVRAARNKCTLYTSAIERAFRDGINLPAVGPIRRIQVDEIDQDQPARIEIRAGARAEIRTMLVSGLADLYET